MKQTLFLLHSTEETVNSSGVIMAKKEMKKSNSKTKIFKFPIDFQESISLCKKWLLGKMKWLRRGTKRDFVCSGSFQEATGWVLVMGQLCGLMPVVGVMAGSASKLHFKWTSFRALYSFVVFLSVLMYQIMSVMVACRGNFEFDLMLPVIWFGAVAYGTICFGKIAMKWPRIMRQWESIEAEMPKYRTQKEKEKLARHVKKLSLIMLLGSVLEHSSNIFAILHYSIHCLRQEEPVKELLYVQLSSFFAYLPFSFSVAFLGKISTVLATFSWSYFDLFLMVISYGLSSRFKQINDELERVKGDHMPENYWALKRSQYRRLCNLCTIVDEAVSQLIFLSFANNLFFICVQLLKSIRPMTSIPHAIYFWFSLLFLIARTLAVSLYSSRIHDESKRPANVLRAVPNSSWSIEVRRFCEQVVHDTVALTGMKFFYLTRRLILTVAGTIITFELVLLQNHTDDFTPQPCRNAS